jgi:Polyketide cyclase / dehydrase and lipid transport
MTEIRIAANSLLPPERVLAAGHDFSDRRAAVFPAVRLEHFQVHELGEDWADATEGTPAGIGVNWERCRYDWSQPDTVIATVTASNVYAIPGSSWELRAHPADGGSRVEMIWRREFAPGVRGRVFGTLFRLLGKPIFRRYAHQTLKNLSHLEQPPS